MINYIIICLITFLDLVYKIICKLYQPKLINLIYFQSNLAKIISKINEDLLKNIRNMTQFKKLDNSSKWQGKNQGEKHALTLADMDFPIHLPFKQQLIKQISQLNNLTYKNRSKQYYSSIISWYNKVYSFDQINKNVLTKRLQQNNRKQIVTQQQQKIFQLWMVECPSICNLIGSSIIAMTQQNDNILIFTPVYAFYINSISQLKRNVITLELKQQKVRNQQINHIFQYVLDLNLFKQKMRIHKPKLIILSHPHNPSGKIFTFQQLKFIVQIASVHDCYILSDQIMGDFALHDSQKQTSQSFHSILQFSYQKIIVGNSISKVFNFQSVQAGYGIIKDSATRQKYNKISHNALKHLTNQMSLILTPIAYTVEGNKWIRQVNQVFRQNYQLLKYQTRKYNNNIKIVRLQSGYLTNIQFLPTSITQQIGSILAGYGIYFVDIKNYFSPKSQRSIFRIAISVPTSQFIKFLSKFKQCLEFIYGSNPQQLKNQNNFDIKKSRL